VDGPTAAGGYVRADSREVDSLEDGSMAALFPAAVSRAVVCRVAAAACQAVPVLGVCGRDAPAVPVLAASELARDARAGDVPQAAGAVPRVAVDVRRCLPQVLLPVQAELAGCPAAAADDPVHATRVAASRRDNRRDCRR
jgi:hypothetical protein